jgi:uncharacterized protein YndB with AHSA1/START domain
MKNRENEGDERMAQPPTARVVSDREFVLEHHFRAPAAKVFAAYTDPKLLAKWWTPKGGSMTIESMDARPGGGYRYLQTDARGQKSVFVGKYLEVHPVTRLVYTFAVEGQGNEIRATVELKEAHGETHLTLTNQCVSKEVRDMMLQYGAAAGAKAVWTQLEEVLANGS